ncbi:MAG: hypothetical protein ACRDPT_00825 [Streptomycetales bacterium]
MVDLRGLFVGARRRAHFINDYPLPPSVLARLRQRRPELRDDQVEMVIAGLRQWFRVALRAGGGRVVLPSRAVDDLWYAFVLDSKAYARFCAHGLGRFLPRPPEGAMGPARMARTQIDGAYQTYLLACRDEELPRAHDRLPLLFRVDPELELPDGIQYIADCRRDLCIARRNRLPATPGHWPAQRACTASQ